MTEELAFKHRSRDRRNVHSNKRPFGGGTRPVNATGHQLLAGSRFAGDHDGVTAAGHDLCIGKQGPHPGAPGDDFRKGIRYFLMHVPGRGRQPDEKSPALIGPLNGQEKKIVVHWLDEIVIGAQTDGLHRGGNVVNGGENDKLRMGTVGFRGFKHLQAIYFGHEQIEENDIEFDFPDARNGILAVVADLHIPDAPPPQETPDGTQRYFFVIDNKDLHNLCLPNSRINVCNCEMLKGFRRRWSGLTADFPPCFKATGSAE